MDLFGLTENEAKKLQRIYGKNISEIKKSNISIILELFLKNSKELFNILLLIASIISFYFKNYLDFILIFLFFLINVFLGIFQEFKSIKYLQKLKEMYKIKVNVIREGKKKKINIEDLVPKDIVILGEGDLIPADGVLIKGKLKVNEATFTGESRAIEKNKNDKLLKGTFVEEGEGIMKVEKIGLETKLGKMNKKLIEIEKGQTIMEKELNKLIFWLFKLLFLLILTIFVIGLINYYPLSFLLVLLISLIIAAIPQGLPLLITTSLALASKKMAKEGILIRKLKSIEEIALIDILFTDKTGTLTENKISIYSIFPKEREKEILQLAGLASFNEKDVIDRLFLKYKTFEEDERKSFNSKDKYSYARLKDLIIYKGAVDSILELFLLKDKRKKGEKEKIIEYWENKANKLSKKGLKLIMVGVENLKEKKFEIKGIIALSDKVREDVKEIVKELNKNQIRLIVLTGDRKETTKAILEKIGVKGKVLDRKDLIKMDNNQLLKELEKTIAFTELLPEDKLRIIEIAKKKYNVGMLGDGVNDSLALKKANVSLVVGDSNDLAKGVADIVLLKNELKKIKDLILEGRKVVYTTKKLAIYTIPTNVVELIVGGIGVFIKKILLKPVQILWINLITDSTPAFLFFKDERKELKKEEVYPLLNNKDKKFIIISSIFFVLFISLTFSKIRKNLILLIIIWEFLYFFFLKQYFEENNVLRYLTILTLIFFVQYFILLIFKKEFEISLFSLYEIKLLFLYLFTFSLTFLIFIELLKFFDLKNNKRTFNF